MPLIKFNFFLKKIVDSFLAKLRKKKHRPIREPISTDENPEATLRLGQ